MSVDLGRQKSIYIFCGETSWEQRKRYIVGIWDGRKWLMMKFSIILWFRRYWTLQLCVTVLEYIDTCLYEVLKVSLLSGYQSIRHSKQNLLPHSSRSYAWDVNLLYSMTHWKRCILLIPVFITWCFQQQLLQQTCTLTLTYLKQNNEKNCFKTTAKMYQQC